MAIRSDPVQVELAGLKTHPRQGDFFANTSEAELRELAADMEVRGQQEPIHCCSDGTIIRGHRRVQSAELLGWKTITAIIRNELGDADDEQVVDELILDNVMRRQLDDLSLARCYHQLKMSNVSSNGDEPGNIRDLLAARLNCGKSGRTLDRLERLLDLPRDIQDMISCGELNKSQGEKLLKLPKKQRDESITSLREGEPVNVVLRRHGIIKSAPATTPSHRGQELLNFLHRYVGKLAQHIGDLDRLQVRGGQALAVLDDAIDFLTAWRDRKQTLREQSISEIEMSFPQVRMREPGQIDQPDR
jgi:ParB/RepB/Spo0J family partition protein